ncbi:MAG: FadR family transcriptional regulator [Actinobacteria bacterium]|nr:FadR family transcriptional regulator [Actinomycetota bacterium]
MRRQADRASVLEPVSVPSAADVVVAQLRRAIELGRFLPGDQLPPERELAVQLGISRVTLRAALAQLERGGLLERAERGSGGGALVVAAGSAVADAGHRALREQFEEIYEFRLACESAAAGLAAVRRTEADLARLEWAIADLQGELTPGRFRAADNAFHLAVADAAGNRWLLSAVEDVRAAMFRPLDAIRFELVVPSAVEHHRRILAAIAARDPERARASIGDHIREAQQELLVALAIGGEPD